MSDECLLYLEFVIWGGYSVGGWKDDRIQGVLQGGVRILERDQIVFYDGRRNITLAALSAKYGRQWVDGKRMRGLPQELNRKGGALTVNLKRREKRLG